jgi:hypothetical protein
MHYLPAFSKFFATVSNNEVVIDNTTLNNIATQKPSTLNPEPNKSDAAKIIAAFMTNRKKPNVTTVIGNVKKTKIGLTNILSRINRMETKIAIDISVTSTPGIKFEIKNIAKEVVIRRNIKFINK